VQLRTEPDWAALARASVRDWEPRSLLPPRRHLTPRSAVPSVDVHNHLGRWLNEGQWMFPDVDELIAEMDASNVELLVNLDGFWGHELDANVNRYDRAHPSRVVTFCWIEWARLAVPDGLATLKATLRDSARRGARGVKVWKNLGLEARDSDGRLILPDDPRVIEVLDLAGQLGLPVLIHVSDPKAYFAPADLHNERLDELLVSPGMWVGDASTYPTFDRLIDALATLVRSTPATRYVGAHVGCAAEDLDRVEQMLTESPNLWIDIAGRLSEIGRQPRRFTGLVERFPERVVLGTDLYPATRQKFEKYFHFLESDDEAFDYLPREPYPPHARWTISGLGLAAEQLEKIYSTNAKAWLGIA
jgi:predicted TIM-barrel fold metal-dependent hydrolase